MEPAIEIVKNRVENALLENLEFLLNKTLDPGQDRQAMVNLLDFKFTWNNFEKEEAEFEELVAQLPLNMPKEYLFALMMNASFPYSLRKKLPYEELSTMRDLAQKARCVINRTPISKYPRESGSTKKASLLEHPVIKMDTTAWDDQSEEEDMETDEKFDSMWDTLTTEQQLHILATFSNHAKSANNIKNKPLICSYCGTKGHTMRKCGACRKKLKSQNSNSF